MAAPGGRGLYPLGLLSHVTVAEHQVQPGRHLCLPVDIHVLLHVCVASQQGAAQEVVGPRVIKSARKGEPKVRDHKARGAWDYTHRACLTG